MNWDNLLEWSEEDWKKLGETRHHHPKCKDPSSAILEGYTPRITHGGSRISWMDAQSQFGHQCATGIRTQSWQKKRRSGDAAQMEEVLEHLAAIPDDEEAKRELAGLALKQLARIATGRGAQQLRALELISDMAKVGLGVAKSGSMEECLIFKGEVECPSCQQKHEPFQVELTGKTLGELQRSLSVLDEVLGEGENGPG